MLFFQEEALRKIKANEPGVSLVQLPDYSQAYTFSHLIIALVVAIISFILGKWIF